MESWSERKHSIKIVKIAIVIGKKGGEQSYRHERFILKLKRIIGVSVYIQYALEPTETSQNNLKTISKLTFEGIKHGDTRYTRDEPSHISPPDSDSPTHPCRLTYQSRPLAPGHYLFSLPWLAGAVA
jgi:hypothetical protein